MKVIYSFKKFNHHYKPLDDTFYKVAATSVASASKFYKTKMYCDSQSAALFQEKNINFDEVVILSSIDNYNGKLYSIPKILAMIEESEPYIHLDLDALIFEKIYSPHTITYAYKEVELKNNSKTDQIDYLNKYYVNPYNNFLKNILSEMNPSWSTIPNHSFVMVKTPQLVKTIYETLLSKIPEDVLENISPMLIEQFLLYQTLKDNKVDIGWVSEFPTESITSTLMGSFKLFHFQFYYEKGRKSEIDSILNLLTDTYDINVNLNPRLF